ncbi:MAG: glycosyltransferase [Bacilli bacterium]|nr:glycosyltransferase [Bacilli bacterium]
MSSYNLYKNECFNWLKLNYNKGNTILDIGAGSGKWGIALNNYFVMDAVEVWEDNINKFNLKDIYRNLYKSDILAFDFEYYDIVILGDILEHLSVEEAQLLLDRMYNKCKQLLVVVPYNYEQDDLGGNPYEIHKQPDLTEKLFLERYKGFKLLFGNDMYGYFIKDNTEYKRLSIIIPQFNETEEELSLALNSIKYQQGINKDLIEVIIVNGGSDIEPSKEFLDTFGLDIKLIKMEVDEGAGQSRQMGINNAKGDYILFLDADDCLYTCNSLRRIMDYNIIDDRVFGKFYGQTSNQKSDEDTWLHGKFYKRKYLLEHNICFFKGIRVNEDGVFNILSSAYPNSTLKIDEVITYWRDNPKSTTRKNYSDFTITQMEDFIKAKDILCNRMFSENKNEIGKLTLLHTITYLYYYMMNNIFIGKEEIQIKYEKMLAKMIKRYYSYWRELKDGDFNRMLGEIYRKMSIDPSYRIIETWNTFLDRLYCYNI